MDGGGLSVTNHDLRRRHEHGQGVLMGWFIYWTKPSLSTIMKHERLRPLCLQALSQTRAGASVISVSDMIDGSIRAIRDALNAEGFDSVPIMTYTAKFASNEYLPSCESLYLNLRFHENETKIHMNTVNKMKKDSFDGADIIMVIPGPSNLDIINIFYQTSSLPIANCRISGKDDLVIRCTPGCSVLGWKHGLLDEVYKTMDVSVKSFALFPNISSKLKNPTGSEALNEDGLLSRTIRLLKDKYPEIVIYTDASLHPYTPYGHDGFVWENGTIMKHERLRPLCLQALSQARAGASVISVSDMIDGSIRAIRDALNAEGFDNVPIMAYTAKFASNECLPSCESLYLNLMFHENETKIHMNTVNKMKKDSSDGADIIMVIPGPSNLDIINIFYQTSSLPIANCRISGEDDVLIGAMSGCIILEKR